MPAHAEHLNWISQGGLAAPRRGSSMRLTRDDLASPELLNLR
ncbi:hypothetical protein ACFV42_14235 [Streptomyces solisilvae]|nr:MULTISPECIES: hypothetical protein [Streptomyces]